MLNNKTITRLRLIEQFILSEPRRFDMWEAVIPASGSPGMLEQPPCGTACCIAGAAYLVGRKIKNLNSRRFAWGDVKPFAANYFGLTFEQSQRLFYPTSNAWGQVYHDAYRNAKSPLERAYVGVARIERFIATNGDE